MTLHKEGIPIIWKSIVWLSSINLTLAYLISDLPSLKIAVLIISIAIMILILQFFRSPKRTPIMLEGKVIAPCDGKVVVIEEVYESEYFKGPRLQVSIFMSPFNVHVNWTPVAGKVHYFQYHPGTHLVAWHPKSSEKNERTTTVVRMDTGVDILFRQIAGALARRVCWYITPDQQIAQGSEMGFIKFGSRMDVFLPLDADVKVKLGDKTQGTFTILAQLK
ncbi:phosphatidylserine decarboxylase family protein [Sphingobacterium sp. SYP-B4668]|uniref:phosphatidylserine decarboxylase family protein n=1 Tax=Sphingobacterium sp. SYP-B4668 TaxID=2996035 RepID=UPI0022DDCF8C|nr:phosphatidylserine decarboxylase family protein [Sphingobacterium sp. SYP-B4668]